MQTLVRAEVYDPCRGWVGGFKYGIFDFSMPYPENDFPNWDEISMGSPYCAPNDILFAFPSQEIAIQYLQITEPNTFQRIRFIEILAKEVQYGRSGHQAIFDKNTVVRSKVIAEFPLFDS